MTGAMDLAAAGSKVVMGRGGGTGPSDPFVQYTDSPSAVPLGYQQIALGSGAASLTVPAGAIYALIAVETEAVRWRDDGTPPTASIGMPVAAGELMTYRGALSAIQFIGQGAGAVLDVSYYQ